MSNSKFAMPSLSCLFSFYIISIICYFLVSLLFMHACTHKTSGFIGGKGPRPLKIVILPDKGKSVNLDFDYLRLILSTKMCAL